ncbi:hypothetical protein ACUZ9N_02925 [Mycoplasmopsis gallinarum]
MSKTKAALITAGVILGTAAVTTAIAVPVTMHLNQKNQANQKELTLEEFLNGNEVHKIDPKIKAATYPTEYQLATDFIKTASWKNKYVITQDKVGNNDLSGFIIVKQFAQDYDTKETLQKLTVIPGFKTVDYDVTKKQYNPATFTVTNKFATKEELNRFLDSLKGQNIMQSNDSHITIAALPATYAEILNSYEYSEDGSKLILNSTYSVLLNNDYVDENGVLQQRSERLENVAKVTEIALDTIVENDENLPEEKAARAELNTLKTDIETFETSLNENTYDSDAKVQALKTKVGELKTQADTLGQETYLKDRTETIQEYKTKLEDLKTEFANIQSYNTLTNNIATYATDLSDANYENDKKVTALKNKVTALKGKVETLGSEESLTANASTLQEYNTEYEALKAELTSITTFNTLNANTTELETKINKDEYASNEKVQALKSEMTALKEKVTALAEKDELTEEDKASLTTLNNDLTALNARFEEAIKPVTPPADSNTEPTSSESTEGNSEGTSPAPSVSEADTNGEATTPTNNDTTTANNPESSTDSSTNNNTGSATGDSTTSTTEAETSPTTSDETTPNA